MQVYLGEEGHEIMALVDTGSKLNIIPEDSEIKAGLTKRCLNMNLRQIGGHCTSIVGLAEFTPIALITWGKKKYTPLCGKLSIKPVATVINFTAEERDFNSNIYTAALNSLREIPLKYKITTNQDLKPQENHIIQEESINSISKPKESEELSKSLEYIIGNQPTNGNDYGEANSNKESRKTNIKNNGDDIKSVLPQEVTSLLIEFSKVLRPEASLNNESNKIQKLNHPYWPLCSR
ncbi:hypothetical protein O181_094193 [Austropuccinia psidii MF-1]|uniref:Peptidase A2 domain-containing protein n=1 Tax=Austropuccinia psidii MF-1 TaxID=1389203 RepID=A0A9Q3PA21_9BASI|nr:hypothetical protein [Austropuccinia psidii MF-1]